MAKRIVKWVLNGAILGMTKALEDPKAEAVIEAEFDLEKLQAAIVAHEDFRLQFLTFAAKQKLMDTGSSKVGDANGKIASAKKRFAEMLEGKWTGERVNKTGAAENKKQLGAVKEAAKAVTLQGLVMKQMLSTLPGNPEFTKEDQAKLDEFLLVLAKATKK